MIFFLPQKIGTGGAIQTVANKRCHVAPNLLESKLLDRVCDNRKRQSSSLLMVPAIMPLSFRPTFFYAITLDPTAA
jgi:hypothetical protein